MASYLIALLLSLAGPLALSFHWHVRRAIWSCPWRLFLSILGMSVPFWVWDVAVTARGHWSFSEAHTLPYRLWLLPLEEWLFFPVVGFIAIFLWEAVGYYQRARSALTQKSPNPSPMPMPLPQTKELSTPKSEVSPHVPNEKGNTPSETDSP